MQVVLLRELHVAAYGVELIYIFGLGTWLFCTGLGAMLFSRNITTRRYLEYVFIFSAYAIIITLPLTHELRRLFADIPGSYLPISIQLISTLLIIAPVAISCGILFQLSARLFMQAGGNFARAYAIESIGALLGGALSTLLILRGISNLALAIITIFLAFFAVLVLHNLANIKRLVIATILILIITLLSLPFSPELNTFLIRRTHTNLVSTHDSAYGRLTLTQNDNQYSLYINDTLSYIDHDPEAEIFVTLAGIQRKLSKTFLILGDAGGALLSQTMRFNPHKAVAVELDKLFFNTTVPHLPIAIQNYFKSDQVQFTIADPRNYIKQSDKYDVIIVGAPNPSSGQSNRFYTQEFFDICARHLKSGGVIALRLSGAANLYTAFQAKLLASVTHALQLAFNDIVILPGDTAILIGSNKPLIRNAAILSQHLELLNPQSNATPSALVHYLYENDRFIAINKLAKLTTVTANSDTLPISYHYNSLVWLEQLSQSNFLLDLHNMFSQHHLVIVVSICFISLFLGLSLFLRHQKVGRYLALAFCAGFAGMVFEAITTVNYQIKQGILFQDIGILLTMFMMGIALGTILLSKNAYVNRRLLNIILISFCAICFVCAYTIQHGASFSLIISLLLLLIAGSYTGISFAFASIQISQTNKTALGILYAVDLAGGALGAFCTGILLVPIIGIPISLLFCAVIVMVSLIFVL
ncbi:MAG: hypothetical protein JW841_11645 [Deltaproteobacteria bacterium]|nr:hypothetical protein [Deltaproteobacteria bacterium]